MISTSANEDDIPDNTQPQGFNPVKIAQVDYLGEQHTNSCTHRDLGFVGQVAGRWFAIYGDTLWCKPGVTDSSQDPEGFHGMVRDSIAECTDNALRVNFTQLNEDTPVAHPKQFVPYNEAWGESITTGFGGTSLCPVDEENSLLFFLVNQNSEGLVGAGVAQVQLRDGIPTVVKRYGDNGWWWNANSEARYGDVAAYRDENSEFIYGWGGAPTNIKDFVPGQYVYQVRVMASAAWDKSQYEYWWGRSAGWKNAPLTTFNKETAVMWGVGQGSTYYSPYYKCYFYVHFNNADISIRTAPTPEGPWAADVKVYTPTPIQGGFTYSPGIHPYLDPTGRSLTINYTNNNHIQVIKATFE
ncbi:hypothetical protein BGW36DRAFT_422367 [Talaromyces proteolyticus]|uniref:DUF4185 domain-containing protein n=1 Tax=Talaromyces proteolyticus TaxID=1131652 RepID=A0AAD4L8G6_9EURO|nr:uncharacterized protein BGW36DRAFT_422367 [Talaromyces proteolyticus]KAH8705829.1 hypothetical protein BGW36DRAFT_422367 [Talaromyces proteolyticus]